MKRTIRILFCTLFMVVLVSGIALSEGMKGAEESQEVAITGTVNSNNQLVDQDGQIMEIADTEEGKELLTHAGQKVTVKGTVMENEGKTEISVSNYEIIKEAPKY